MLSIQRFINFFILRITFSNLFPNFQNHCDPAHRKLTNLFGRHLEKLPNQASKDKSGVGIIVNYSTDGTAVNCV